jgi:uncharacterized protein (DUF305 family)
MAVLSCVCRRTIAVDLLVLVAIAACGTTSAAPATSSIPAATQPVPGNVSSGVVKTDSGPTRYTDTQFMQGMIAHHAQALVMTDMVPARTGREDMRLLAKRIEVSQKDEIAMMQRWLKQRRAEVPSADAHHHMAAGHEHLMPGMLSDEELAQLAKATGAEFERLFLRFMIRHHEGALTMVADLFATPGAGQDPDVFRFATDVEADQRAEIRRMQTLLQDLK